MLRAVGGDGEAGTVMLAALDLPVVDAHPAHAARRAVVLEGDDRMIAHRAREDVAEHDRWLAGTGESDTEAAALAGIVDGYRCLAEGRTIIGPGIGERGAGVGSSGRTCGRDVALVEPGGEHASRGIDGGGLEALAGLVGGEGLGDREAGALIGRA